MEIFPERHPSDKAQKIDCREPNAISDPQIRLIEDSDLIWQAQFSREHETGSRNREQIVSILTKYIKNVKARVIEPEFDKDKTPAIAFKSGIFSCKIIMIFCDIKNYGNIPDNHRARYYEFKDYEINLIIDFAQESFHCENCSPNIVAMMAKASIKHGENGTLPKAQLPNLDICQKKVQCRILYDIFGELLALYTDMKIIYYPKVVDGNFSEIDNGAVIKNACEAFSVRYKNFAINVLIRVTRSMLGSPILEDLFRKTDEKIQPLSDKRDHLNYFRLLLFYRQWRRMHRHQAHRRNEIVQIAKNKLRTPVNLRSHPLLNAIKPQQIQLPEKDLTLFLLVTPLVETNRAVAKFIEWEKEINETNRKNLTTPDESVQSLDKCNIIDLDDDVDDDDDCVVIIEDPVLDDDDPVIVIDDVVTIVDEPIIKSGLSPKPVTEKSIEVSQQDEPQVEITTETQEKIIPAIERADEILKENNTEDVTVPIISTPGDLLQVTDETTDRTEQSLEETPSILNETEEVREGNEFTKPFLPEELKVLPLDVEENESTCPLLPSDVSDIESILADDDVHPDEASRQVQLSLTNSYEASDMDLTLPHVSNDNNEDETIEAIADEVRSMTSMEVGGTSGASSEDEFGLDVDDPCEKTDNKKSVKKKHAVLASVRSPKFKSLVNQTGNSKSGIKRSIIDEESLLDQTTPKDVDEDIRNLFCGEEVIKELQTTKVKAPVVRIPICNRINEMVEQQSTTEFNGFTSEEKNGNCSSDGNCSQHLKVLISRQAAKPDPKPKKARVEPITSNLRTILKVKNSKPKSTKSIHISSDTHTRYIDDEEFKEDIRYDGVLENVTGRQLEFNSDVLQTKYRNGGTNILQEVHYGKKVLDAQQDIKTENTTKSSRRASKDRDPYSNHNFKLQPKNHPNELPPFGYSPERQPQRQSISHSKNPRRTSFANNYYDSNDENSDTDSSLSFNFKKVSRKPRKSTKFFNYTSDSDSSSLSRVPYSKQNLPNYSDWDSDSVYSEVSRSRSRNGQKRSLSIESRGSRSSSRLLKKREAAMAADWDNMSVYSDASSLDRCKVGTKRDLSIESRASKNSSRFSKKRDTGVSVSFKNEAIPQPSKARASRSRKRRADTVQKKRGVKTNNYVHMENEIPTYPNIPFVPKISPAPVTKTRHDYLSEEEHMCQDVPVNIRRSSYGAPVVPDALSWSLRERTIIPTVTHRYRTRSRSREASKKETSPMLQLSYRSQSFRTKMLTVEPQEDYKQKLFKRLKQKFRITKECVVIVAHLEKILVDSRKTREIWDTNIKSTSSSMKTADEVAKEKKPSNQLRISVQNSSVILRF